VKKKAKEKIREKTKTPPSKSRAQGDIMEKNQFRSNR